MACGKAGLPSPACRNLLLPGDAHLLCDLVAAKYQFIPTNSSANTTGTEMNRYACCRLPADDF